MPGKYKYCKRPFIMPGNSLCRESPLSPKLTHLGECSPSAAECTDTLTGPWLPGPRTMTPGFPQARGARCLGAPRTATAWGLGKTRDGIAGRPGTSASRRRGPRAANPTRLRLPRHRVRDASHPARLDSAGPPHLPVWQGLIS